MLLYTWNTGTDDFARHVFTHILKVISIQILKLLSKSNFKKKKKNQDLAQDFPQP